MRPFFFGVEYEQPLAAMHVFFPQADARSPNLMATVQVEGSPRSKGEAVRRAADQFASYSDSDFARMRAVARPVDHRFLNRLERGLIDWRPLCWRFDRIPVSIDDAGRIAS